MSERKIIVKISNKGMAVEAEGFEGEGCMKATEFLEKLGQVETVDKKPEFYQMKNEMVDNSIYEG